MASAPKLPKRPRQGSSANANTAAPKTSGRPAKNGPRVAKQTARGYKTPGVGGSRSC